MQQTQDDQHHDLGDGASSTEGSSLITKASPADNDGDARASRSTGRGSRETPQRPDVPAANLKRYPLIIVLTAIYVAASTAAWVLLCIMTKRPINGTTYGYEHGYEYEYSDQEQDNQAVFVQNERYLRAVRILQSGVSVFTIPLTSAVCSRAAVVFAQRRLSPAGNSNITLRQTMALADKGWTDPSIIAKLVFGKWRQYGSWFLLFALAMNAFGKTPRETFQPRSFLPSMAYVLTIPRGPHFPASGTVCLVQVSQDTRIPGCNRGHSGL